MFANQGFGSTPDEDYQSALNEYNRLMDLGLLTTEATSRLMAAEMAVKPTIAQPTITVPTGEVIYPSLVGPGGEYTPPPITEIHSPYETYLPSTQEIIGGQGETFSPTVTEPPITITPPIISSMSPIQRMNYYITQFGSPQLYANEIWKKVSNGVPLDDADAARAFVGTYPSLFPSVNTISPLVINNVLPDWWPILPYTESEGWYPWIPTIPIVSTAFPLTTTQRLEHLLQRGTPQEFADYLNTHGDSGFSSDIVSLFKSKYPELFTVTPSVIEKETSPITSMIAGFDLGSNWPILAIVGIGLLMSFKGGKKGGVKSRKRTRKNPCRRRR